MTLKDKLDKSKEILNVRKNVGLSSPELQELARVMYEVQGRTLVEIAPLVGKSRATLEKWSSSLGWSKRGSNRVSLQENARQKFLDVLTELEFTPDKAMQALVQGLTEPMKAPVVIEDGEDSKGKIKYKTIVEPDHGTRHKFMQTYLQLNNITGQGSQPPSHNNGVGSINIQVNIPEKEDLN